MYSQITGIGSYLPGPPVANDELARRGIDTSDEWIASRTGIRFRHLAENGETSSDLALHASRQALAAAGCAATAIDLIIVATSTPDFIFPSTACLLQAKLGNQGATAFDVQAVCSGFVYALTVADKFIRSGSHRRALVVGAEDRGVRKTVAEACDMRASIPLARDFDSLNAAVAAGVLLYEIQRQRLLTSA